MQVWDLSISMKKRLTSRRLPYRWWLADIRRFNHRWDVFQTHLNNGDICLISTVEFTGFVNINDVYLNWIQFQHGTYGTNQTSKPIDIPTFHRTLSTSDLEQSYRTCRVEFLSNLFILHPSQKYHGLFVVVFYAVIFKMERYITTLINEVNEFMCIYQLAIFNIVDCWMSIHD